MHRLFWDQMSCGSRLFVVITLALAGACGPSAPGSPTPLSRAAPCIPSDPPDNVVYDSTQVERRPRVLAAPDLRYPTELRRLGIEGDAVLAVVIDALGRPEPRSIVVRSATSPAFALEARDALRHTRFVPGCRDGHSVRVRAVFPFRFRLRD